MGSSMYKKQPGRPRVEVNWDSFRELCAMQHTQEEICAVLGICKDTLYLRVMEEYGVSYSTKYEEFAAHGKSSLRRAQWSKAIKEKSENMQKHLGKYYLGQDETIKVEGTLGLAITAKDVLDIIEKEKRGRNK
jgi:hypothetical protein